MLGIDEVLHRVKQASSQQEPGFGSSTRGYVASYDPNRHAVRVYLPTLRDENDTPVLTDWIPISGPWVGRNFGFQWIPEQGATEENPTLGEPVLVHILDQQRGILVAGGFFYHDSMQPPATNPALTSKLQPSEGVLMHKTGTYVRFYSNGNVEINSTDQLIVNTQGNVTVTAGGNVKVQTSGLVQVFAGTIQLASSAMSTLFQLCTNVFFSWSISHTHGTGPPPNNPPSPQAGSLTRVVTAE